MVTGGLGSVFVKHRWFNDGTRNMYRESTKHCLHPSSPYQSLSPHPPRLSPPPTRSPYPFPPSPPLHPVLPSPHPNIHLSPSIAASHALGTAARKDATMALSLFSFLAHCLS